MRGHGLAAVGENGIAPGRLMPANTSVRCSIVDGWRT